MVDFVRNQHPGNRLSGGHVMALSLYFRPNRISEGISVESQRRGEGAYFTKTCFHSDLLFHSVSFMCMLHLSVPREEEGFLSFFASL